MNDESEKTYSREKEKVQKEKLKGRTDFEYVKLWEKIGGGNKKGIGKGVLRRVKE